MKKNYALELLESLLHELKTQSPNARTEDQTAMVIQTIANEKIKIFNRLKTEIFNLKQEEHTRVMIQKYYNAIILLINQTYNLQKKAQDWDSNTVEILEYLFMTLEEIQQFIELSYPSFLSPEERVGLPELMALKVEIEDKIERLPEVLLAGNNNEKAIGIVIDSFHEFIRRIDKQHFITLKEYNYQKLFLNDLLKRGHEPSVLPDCPTLHELLPYWNFNSNESITYFRTGLEQLIKEQLTPAAKLEFMYFQFKRLLHIPVMPQTIFDKNLPSMKSFFCDWLEHEIDYLEHKTDEVTPLLEATAKAREKSAPIKVLVSLTADQIGLFLRACKELGVILSKSIEAVFKAMIPFLSTKNKEDLSWKTMIGKIYAGKDRDIDQLLDVIEQVQKKVESYRDR
jgi:hypothetical protein